MRQSLLAEVAACRRSDPWPTPRRLPSALDHTCIAPQLLLVTAVLCSCVATTAYQFYLLRLFSAVASLLLVQFYRCQCYLLRLFSAVASLSLCNSATCSVLPVPVLRVTVVLCSCIATTVYQWYLYSFIGASGRCYR